MRLIDVDAFKADYRMAGECKDCQTSVRTCEYDRVYTKMDFCSWLDDAPTVSPERKKGRWIPQDYNQRHGNISTTVYYYPKCSVCGCSGDYTDAFCKSCGAEMR